MASNGFDLSQLQAYERDLLKMAISFKNGKHAKKFLREEGTKLRKKTVAKAKSKVKKLTNSYLKGIKRGKVYNYNGNDTSAIRVYGASPHSHLIEYGHRQVTKDGQEIGFVQGYHVFEEASNEFDGEFFNDVQHFIDDVIEKGLGL